MIPEGLRVEGGLNPGFRSDLPRAPKRKALLSWPAAEGMESRCAGLGGSTQNRGLSTSFPLSSVVVWGHQQGAQSSAEKGPQLPLSLR